MSFVVHTEKLNLVSAVAEAEHDEEEQQQRFLLLHKHNNNNTTSADEDNTIPAATAAAAAAVPSHWHELCAVVQLAIPTAIIQLGGTIPGFFTASYIGRHLGVIALDGFTLAMLTGNLFTLSLMYGLFTASDTLSPQAYGAGNKSEVGLLAIRGYCGSLLVTVPMAAVLAVRMEDGLRWVGMDPEVAHAAWRWYQIYVLALPFYALYNVTWKFLSAQNVMTPLTVCVLVSCGIVLPLALSTLGGVWGYWGTAIAIDIYLIFQALSLIGYLWYFQPHDVETWPGLCAGWKPALQWKPFAAFLALGAGGMLASSEWIYWEALSMIIGTFGTVPLSVHTIPTQIIMVTMMPAMSWGIALAIRLGATLPVSVPRAQRLVRDCYLASAAVSVPAALILYAGRYTIYSWFTTSPAVVAGADEIWWKVCLYFFLLCIYVVHMGICTGLGLQWTLGISTFFVLWIFGLPMAYYASVTRGGGLNAAWTWVWPPYVVLNVYLAYVTIRVDWEEIAEQIRIREGIELRIVHHKPHISSGLVGVESPSAPRTRGYGAIPTKNGSVP